MHPRPSAENRCLFHFLEPRGGRVCLKGVGATTHLTDRGNKVMRTAVFPLALVIALVVAADSCRGQQSSFRGYGFGTSSSVASGRVRSNSLSGSGFQLPYQSRGTRTDMAPRFRVQQSRPSRPFTPSQSFLRKYAGNVDNLQSEFGLLFLGRQAQLNRAWEQQRRQAASRRVRNQPQPKAIHAARPR